MTDLADERLVSAFMTWWLAEPVPYLGDQKRAAMDDLRTLTAALDSAGFQIVPSPALPAYRPQEDPQ